MRTVRVLFLLASLLVAPETCSEYVGGSPHKSVVNLDPTSFPNAIKDPANPFWLLKFYAPWCGHCKKLAPVLDKVAPQLEGKMAIGKIDCTMHKGLCNQFNVRGYPTMKIALDGDVQDYPGSRDENAIIAFANKMSAPAVHVVTTYDDALEYAATQTEEGVAFLGYDPNYADFAETPSTTFQVFHQAARKQKASAYFVWLNNPEERNYAFIHRIEKGTQPKGYDPEDRELRLETLMEWIQQQNVPLIASLGPQNFHRIGYMGRPLVVSVVDIENEQQTKAVKDHMMNYIQGTKVEETDKYYFGIIDGKKWGKFLEQFRVVPEESPQIIILEVATKKFWQNSTYTNLFDFMKAVEDGSIKPETATKPGRAGVLGQVESVFLDYFPYSLILLIVLVFGFVLLLVPSSEDLRPPYDRIPPEGEDEDEPEEEDEKAETMQESKKEK